MDFLLYILKPRRLELTTADLMIGRFKTFIGKAVLLHYLITKTYWIQITGVYFNYGFKRR